LLVARRDGTLNGKSIKRGERIADDNALPESLLEKLIGVGFLKWEPDMEGEVRPVAMSGAMSEGKIPRTSKKG
jgi:hypothetical protein